MVTKPLQQSDINWQNPPRMFALIHRDVLLQHLWRFAQTPDGLINAHISRNAQELLLHAR